MFKTKSMSSLIVEVKGDAMLASPNSTCIRDIDTKRTLTRWIIWADQYSFPRRTRVLSCRSGFRRCRSSLAFLRLGSMLVMEIPTWACRYVSHSGEQHVCPLVECVTDLLEGSDVVRPIATHESGAAYRCSMISVARFSTWQNSGITTIITTTVHVVLFTHRDHWGMWQGALFALEIRAPIPAPTKWTWASLCILIISLVHNTISTQHYKLLYF